MNTTYVRMVALFVAAGVCGYCIHEHDYGWAAFFAILALKVGDDLNLEDDPK
jgi:hypothetical protein